MFSIFQRKNSEIQSDYDSIMKQARNPLLYQDYGVPDKPIGRFHMIALHAAPQINYYAQNGYRKQAQLLFDIIFKDIELSFREIGVGDLAVPKKMKRYMQDFNGIIQGHAAANADHVEITRRNVFGDDGVMGDDFKNYINGLFHDKK